MDAQSILKVTDPSRLFPKDEKRIKENYRKLVKEWHPDVYKGDKDEASRVMAHVTSLYNKALVRLQEGHWGYESRELIKLTGRTIGYKYKVAHDFELGRMYVGDTSILYKLADGKEKYLRNYVEKASNFTFADQSMQEEMSKFLPVIELVDEQAGVLILKKTTDVYSLRDVLVASGGILEPKHAAWILSGLYNLACYLKYADMVHNGITLDTVFVSPQFHSTLLYGGWWYTTGINDSLVGVPKDVYDLMTPKERADKKASASLDLLAIRKVGRLLLGGLTSGGTRPTDLPDALYSWLTGVDVQDAFKDYTKWSKVLDDSWGHRKFVKLDIDMDTYYSK